ncbi:MAG: potassium channel family protein, partial [Nanoarchaeota archaeon]|nr:potassium channel family protein [Nanoarchaeota archaeon]
MIGIGSAKKRTKESSYKIVEFFNSISFGQVFLYWFLIIIIFGAVYFLLSMTPNNTLMYRGEIIAFNKAGFINSLYFSFITSTSLGYGDIAPLGICKFLSGFEVMLGLIMYGVLISKIVGVKQEIILEEVYDISYEEVIDRLRSGLYLFRSDANRIIEKIETGTIKQREVRDLWILFSNLDNNL